MDVNCQIHTMEQMLSAMVIKVWSLQASSENVLKKIQALWLFPDLLNRKYLRVMPAILALRNIPSDSDAYLLLSV